MLRRAVHNLLKPLASAAIGFSAAAMLYKGDRTGPADGPLANQTEKAQMCDIMVSENLAKDPFMRGVYGILAQPKPNDQVTQQQ